MIITPNIGTIERRLCDRMKQWAPQLAAAEMCYQTDPFALAAIIDRESEGGAGLAPPGPEGRSPQGFGLAQLHQDQHVSFLLAQFPDSRPLWADPSIHILYTARIFKGLCESFPTPDGPDLPAAVAAFDVGIRKVKGILCRRSLIDASIQTRIDALDEATSGENYVSDVLERRAAFIGATLS